MAGFGSAILLPSQSSQQAKILMFNHLLKRDILNTLSDSNTYGVRCGTPYFKVRVEVLF